MSNLQILIALLGTVVFHFCLGAGWVFAATYLSLHLVSNLILNE
jgi:hypothetical protein